MRDGSDDREVREPGGSNERRLENVYVGEDLDVGPREETEIDESVPPDDHGARKTRTNSWIFGAIRVAFFPTAKTRGSPPRSPSTIQVS